MSDSLRFSLVELGLLPTLTLFPGEQSEDAIQEPVRNAARAVVIHISCAVLKIGYLPEKLLISLSVPATPEEATSAIQAVRSRDNRRLFPTLLSVLPQPCLGTAVFLALPSWQPGTQRHVHSTRQGSTTESLQQICRITSPGMRC